jgi:hypothetical protein
MIGSFNNGFLKRVHKGCIDERPGTMKNGLLEK